ncbi:RibD family protein [Halorhodospira halophila]|uniref:RibD family protein n=1 Tax=Halorhodospira halophila TaxID=1053 RepID=UPI0002FD9D11|nr:dihydrofolate reductase family protein [Halorhodospira halophila]
MYANFVTSLDGRISLDAGVGCRVPGTVANPRDWRLFQELAARADCLITSGRYLRELAAGCAQDALPVGSEFTDLQQWREDQGLNPHPDVAIVSGSADFRIPATLREQGRRIWLFVPEDAATDALRRHQDAGAEVAAQFPGRRVTGRQLRETLGALGYARVYSVAGPQIAHTLVADGSLDTLFKTVRHRIIGGEPGAFETIIEGPGLENPADFRLRWLYFDPGEGPGDEQQLLRLDRVTG